MTESPIAVTCRPGTFGSFAVRHAAAGAEDAAAEDAAEVDEDAGDADGLAETAPGPAPMEVACAEA
jgi:hypothetical protein